MTGNNIVVLIKSLFISCVYRKGGRRQGQGGGIGWDSPLANRPVFEHGCNCWKIYIIWHSLNDYSEYYKYTGLVQSCSM